MASSLIWTFSDHWISVDMGKPKQKESFHSRPTGWEHMSCQSAVMPVLITLVLGAAVVFIAWWVVSTWQTISVIVVPESKVASRIELAKTLAQIVLGALVFGTLYVTWRRAKAAELAVEAAQQAVSVSQEGQITERFTRAIEHLGSENLATRLGGIYALERIAQDSEKDHWQVVEVLAAYVRENSPWDDGAEKDATYKSVTTDIRAILTVLGRRNVEYEKEGQILTLVGADLRGAVLERADFRRADFKHANLQRVFFKEANLQEADFFNANFAVADLRGANLRGANLSGAKNLKKNHLRSAHLDQTTKLPLEFECLTRGQNL